jgi:hypothetical protein
MLERLVWGMGDGCRHGPSRLLSNLASESDGEEIDIYWRRESWTAKLID